MGLLISKFIFAQTNVQSQSVFYRQYTTANGLPSSEVYKVIQDKKGFMWFSTNYGVSRFDGYKFTNYSTKDGLPENTVFDIFEDYKGRIWFLTMSFKLCYFENNKVYTYQYNDLIHKCVGAVLPAIGTLFVDSLDNVSAATLPKSFIISQKGVMKEFLNYKLENDKNKSVHVLNNDKPANVFRALFLGGLSTSLSRDLPIFEPYRERAYLRKNNKFPYKIAFYRMEIAYSKDFLNLKYLTFKDNISNMFVDSRNRLFVCTSNGVVYFTDGNLGSPSIRYLDGIKTTSIAEDREGGYWITTSDNGVFYAPSFEVESYNTNNGLINKNITCLEYDKLNKNLYFGYYANYVGKLSEGIINNFLVTNEKSVDTYRVIRSIYKQGANLFIGTNSLIYLLNEKRNNQITPISTILEYKKEKPSAYTPCPLKFIPSKDSGFWLGGYTKLLKFDKNNKNTFDSFNTDSIVHRCDGIYEDSKGTVWIGSTDGLWRFYPDRKQNRYINYGKNIPILKNRILDVKNIPNTNLLLLGTKGFGMLVFDMEKNTVREINADNGLSSNYVSNLCVDGNKVWASTNKGISKITFSSLSDFKYSIDIYSKNDGLPSDEINQVLAAEGKLYIATNSGLAIVDESKLTQNSVAPPIYISSVKVNNRDTVVAPSYVLPYDKNMLYISFVGLSYKNTGAVKYKYMMEGIDKDWKYTYTTEIQYTTLPHGEYKFVVYAMNNSGVWSKVPANVIFRISPPFWKTWWFILLICLTVLLLFYVFYAYRMRTVALRNNLQLELSKNMNKAMSAQMNPHFIFNSLNAIQLFVLKNDPDTSNKYLINFSKLIRMTLNNSQHQMISLADELESLKLFLNIESLRIGADFSYEIVLDDNVDVEIFKVPPMLIQPYVENSIWHGLMHKSGSKNLKLEIKKTSERMMMFVIEDNGVGREVAAQKKNSNHKSLGTKITENRLKMMDSLYKCKTSVNFVDMKNERDESLGTRVEIEIPIVK